MDGITSELTRESQPGDRVKWKTRSGKEWTGILLEWDNGTAIVLTLDGEKAVRCD